MSARTWAIVPTRLASTSVDTLAVVSADGRRHRLRFVLPGAGGGRTLLTAGVPASGRAVIDLAEVSTRSDLAVLVSADGPVVIERESVQPGFTRSHAVPG
jgi:hypothetical protein